MKEYMKKNYVRNMMVGFSTKDYQSKKNITKKIESEYLDIIEFIKYYSGDANIVDELIQKRDIKNKKNIVEICVENRKKIMEKVIDGYTKKAIMNDITTPANSSTIDAAINIVNNYYDMIYAREFLGQEFKPLPEYPEFELDEFKYKAFNEIKPKVGVEGIQNSFKSSKKKNFANYCLNKTEQYVRGFNLEVGKLNDNSDIEYASVDIDTINVSETAKSNLQSKVPTFLGLLKESYESRSKAERFFSYFPFINPTAKAERKAINDITRLMVEHCVGKMTKKELNDLAVKALNDRDNKYYEDEIKKLEHVAIKNNSKEKILVDEVNDSVAEVFKDNISEIKEEKYKEESLEDNLLV